MIASNIAPAEESYSLANEANNAFDGLSDHRLRYVATVRGQLSLVYCQMCRVRHFCFGAANSISQLSLYSLWLNHYWNGACDFCARLTFHRGPLADIDAFASCRRVVSLWLQPLATAFGYRLATTLLRQLLIAATLAEAAACRNIYLVPSLPCSLRFCQQNLHLTLP